MEKNLSKFWNSAQHFLVNIFMGRDKVTVTFYMCVTNIECFSHTTELQIEIGLARKPKVLPLQMPTRLQKIAYSRQFLVTRRSECKK